MTLAQEIREAFAKIRQRYEHDHDAIAGVRVSHIKATEKHIEALEDRVAKCTCDHAPGFEINTRRNNGPLDAALTLKRFKRMAAEDGRAVL